MCLPYMAGALKAADSSERNEQAVNRFLKLVTRAKCLEEDAVSGRVNDWPVYRMSCKRVPGDPVLAKTAEAVALLVVIVSRDVGCCGLWLYCNVDKH